MLSYSGRENMVKKRSAESASVLAEESPKRPCADTDNDSDSFEEFFALLQRIEATKRHFRAGNRQETAQKSTEAGKASDAKAVTAQGLWRPSFEWEDFLPRGNGTRHVDWKTGDQKLEQRERVAAEANMEGDRRLDLNLPLELMPL